MKTFREFLIEKLTLAYHGTLNQKLFDGDVLKPEVKDKLLEIARAWQKFSKIPDDLVQDIIMTGGNAAFTYSEKSDIDLHLVIDKSKFLGNREMIDDYFDGKKSLWADKHKNKIHGYPVELFAQDISDNLVASGIYSLKNNMWIMKPSNKKINFKDNKELLDKIDEYETRIYNMLKSRNAANGLKIIKKDLKKLRETSLKKDGEFGIGNLVFKSLRNSGYLDKMNKYIGNYEDKELSI